MKILALDIGDRWTGVAISDPLGILPRPYDTIKTTELFTSLEKIIQKERIGTIVVGLPTTMRGTESDQTKKVIAMSETLKNLFPSLEWKMWDERLTSKQAASLKSTKTKDDKLRSHAIAAAIFLSSYLEYKRFHENPDDLPQE
ncbi:MAG TPA: Holliday junction resolvase RuvX [Candidatus Babeliales bacterium]|nr:Holliday junction resolvase RuvX [Candidatus Babeliales bacterium]